MKSYAILLAALFTVAAAQGAVYSGSLTSGAGGGIFATDGWNSTSTVLSYTVTTPPDSGNGYFHYRYEYTIPTKAVSHFILELSTNVTCDSGDILNLSYTGMPVEPVANGDGGDECGIGWYTPEDSGNSNPGLPGNIYGLKINTTNDPVTFVIEFDSTRQPTWGDFYAKDGVSGGQDVYAYNLGFTTADPPVDPNDPGYIPPSDISYMNKILVPDTIPEPATALLVVLGGLATLMRRRSA